MDQYRENTNHLNDIKVMDGQGNLLSLGSIATFDKKSGTPQIKRFDFKVVEDSGFEKIALTMERYHRRNLTPP